MSPQAHNVATSRRCQHELDRLAAGGDEQVSFEAIEAIVVASLAGTKASVGIIGLVLFVFLACFVLFRTLRAGLMGFVVVLLARIFLLARIQAATTNADVIAGRDRDAVYSIDAFRVTLLGCFSE
jgi:hypothetical protein